MEEQQMIIHLISYIFKLLSNNFYNILMKSSKVQGERNDSIQRNGLLFSILSLVTHVLTCFMFGFFFYVPAQTSVVANTVESNIITPIFNTFAHAMLVIVGFGLVFSYLRKMAFSGVGFALLITVLCFEFFFLFNAFWVNARVLQTSNTSFTDNETFNLYLSVLNQPANTPYNTTITGAFRCSLAIIIAFSSILGRAGPLEAWIVSLIGSIGYELNRQIIENFSYDVGGSFSIFIYGGFMGLVIGLFRSLRERDDHTTTEKHPQYTAISFSSNLALIGTLIIWVFFPILVFDNADDTISTNGKYTGPFTVMFALASSTIASIMISVLFNGGNIGIRDLIYGSLAGAISSASASYYVTNPVYGILFGFISAIVQVIVMNTIQKNRSRTGRIFNTYSFTLFGVQGLLGCIFASAWQAVAIGYSNEFVYNFDLTNEPSIFGFTDGLISAAMGIGFGVIAGLLVMLAGGHIRENHFTDATYWIADDGIRFMEKEVKMVVREHSKIKNKYSYL